MKFPTPLCCLLALGPTLASVRADQADTVIVAAMKVAEASNYTWISSTERNDRSAEMRGQTNSAGYSLVKFVGYAPPATSTGGHSLRSAMPGDSFETVFLGDTNWVIQTDSGWISPGTQTEASADSGKSNRSTTSSGGTGTGNGTSLGGGGISSGGLGSGGGGTGRRGSRGSRGSSGNGTGSDDSRSESGAPAKFPAGINLPHEELGIIVANYSELHLEGDVASGTLTQIGAELLLVPPGSKDAPPEGTAGTFRLWLKDGIVTKYELTLTAKTAPGGRAVKGGYSQTTIVELKEIGSTTVEVPDAAKRKLAG